MDADLVFESIMIQGQQFNTVARVEYFLSQLRKDDGSFHKSNLKSLTTLFSVPFDQGRCLSGPKAVHYVRYLLTDVFEDIHQRILKSPAKEG